MSKGSKVGLVATFDLTSTKDEPNVDLNFKVSKSFRSAFKVNAVLRGMTSKDFLMTLFADYIKRNPLK